jgi:hypothetical protein
VPEHEVVEVHVPVYSCPVPPELNPLTLPEWPTYPGDHATDEAKRTWYVDMVSTLRARMSMMLERIDMTESLLDAYRDEARSD